MKKYILNFEVTGCPNRCNHCYCYELKSNRSLMSVDEVITLSKEFRENIEGSVNVYLLQEQTMYPKYIELVEKLKENNLINSKREGIVVTNGFGMAYNKTLIKDIYKHFSIIKITLFGLKDIHDNFVNRKGHFDEIIAVTKQSLDIGLKVIWQMMLTKDNSNEISKLIKLAKQLKVDQYFITAGFYYTGIVTSYDKFIPTEKDLMNIDFEVYEVENEMFFPEYKSIELIKEISEIKVNKTSLENLYIDSNFDVYPLSCMDPIYKLGNLKTEMSKIIEMLNNRDKLPESIINRNSLEIEELIKSYADTNSKQMFTSQTMFEKLAYKKRTSN